jgi:uncharacterized membrane protein
LATVPQLWGSWLLLCFGVFASVLVCVETIQSGDYLAALAAAVIGLACAVGVIVPIASRSVRSWWW